MIYGVANVSHKRNWNKSFPDEWQLLHLAQTEDMPRHFYRVQEKKVHPLLCNKSGGEAQISIEIQFESGAPTVAVAMRLKL